MNDGTAGVGFVTAAAALDNALGAGTGMEIVGDGRTACVESSATSAARNGADLGAGIGVNIVLGAAAALDNALRAGTGSEILGDGRTAGVEQSATSVARDGANLGAGIGVNTVLGAGTGHETVLGTVFDSWSGTLEGFSSIANLWIISFFQLLP